MAIDSKEYQRGKRLYYWGLLGFIPLVGALAGLVLVIRGIFEFKDKIMVIIGAACIAFTVFVYSALFNEMKNGTASGYGFSQIAQSQLNTLAKEIEFYKVQNGAYPDSLETLQKDEKFVVISDPLLVREKTVFAKGSNQISFLYHYQKIGEKYTLFSVGVDGIPGTKDDIYPNLVIKDSSKFGLIRMK